MADSSDDSCLKTLTIGIGDNARAIAVRQRTGGNPGLFWLGGFKSDMRGTKAEALDAWGAAHGRAVTRFDYSGHGESGGSFLDGSIGRWLEESLAVYRRFCRGPQVVIGSSMGGWLALLLAQALREQGNGTTGQPHGEEPRSGVSNHEAPSAPIAGMVLIAPAVDFTEVLMWNAFDAEVKREIKLKGAWSRPSQYSHEPYVITRKLIEEGRKHLLLDGVIETGFPVRILQGVQDPDVSWQHAAELVSRFVSDDVVFTLIKDGDHRLSRTEDIERLLSAVAEF
ncbi:MAG: 2-hydroxymuconic semialdehyde hydrolase [Pseudolabrys sp.]|jgi:pimeloyl-ACP methyl ester carboxylesterase|nr:2-hydroxymuconic semialdehyde hydrolase [Pseudolabrys sp.]